MWPLPCAPCSEIVDRAKKEEKIEKDIKKIDITWSTLALVFSPLPDSDVTALQVCQARVPAGTDSICDASCWT
jgi:hypothetical protein